jgi:hypothetical protein
VSGVDEQRAYLRDAAATMLEMTAGTHGSVLTGFVFIAEVLDEHGERGLVVLTGDATGEQPLPPWTADGWCDYVRALGTETVALNDDDVDDDDAG